MLVKHVRQEYEEEQAFKRVYMCMDKDGDELLTLKEIKRAFMANAFEIIHYWSLFRPSFGPKTKIFGTRVQSYHIDRKSQLTLHDFREFVFALKKRLQKQALAKVFDIFDESKDGKLSVLSCKEHCYSVVAKYGHY